MTLLFTMKKTRAEARYSDAGADSLLVGSALDIAKDLRVEVQSLRKRAVEQERKAGQLEAQVEILENHLKLQHQYILQLKDALKSHAPNHRLLELVDPILNA